MGEQLIYIVLPLQMLHINLLFKAKRELESFRSTSLYILTV